MSRFGAQSHLRPIHQVGVVLAIAVLLVGTGVSAAHATEDPLGLLEEPAEVQRYTSGTDVFEVWSCPEAGPVPITVNAWIAEADVELGPFFDWLSDGEYNVAFVTGGTVPSGSDCSDWAKSHTSGTSNGAIYLLNTGGGLATPGLDCSSFPFTCPTTFPANAREGYIGIAGSVWSTAAHEIGHMLSWPHSYTRDPASTLGEYDVAIDLMSGNWASWKIGNVWATGPSKDPYATIAHNRYAAGWIDGSDVLVWDGDEHTVVLSSEPSAGLQSIVVEDGSDVVVFGARTSWALDPFPSAWNGVEAYRIERCAACWGLSTPVKPEPAVPFDRTDLDAYAEPLDHVLSIGDEIEIGDARITVLAGTTSGVSGRMDYQVRVESKWPPTRFDDVHWLHTFRADIEWLAAEGITLGCNPSGGYTLFCPESTVTRGQAAAFFARVLDLPEPSQDYFLDDTESVFQNDINRLAEAGITRGCNPGEGYTRFCPERPMTRGQMAAFFVSALGYTETTAGDRFIDDDTSVFEADIEKIAAAGVTLGCNPPSYDRFCPNDPVTRGQIAAFFHRAFG